MAQETFIEERRKYQLCLIVAPVTLIVLIAALIGFCFLSWKYRHSKNPPLASPEFEWLITLAIIVVAAFYALSFRNLAKSLFCPHCDKHIEKFGRWRCGHCDHENERGFTTTFLNKCGYCEREPKAYVCNHCEKQIQLAAGEARHPARSAVKVTATAQDPTDESRKVHADKKEEIQREIEILELKRRLAVVMASPEFERAKAKSNTIREKFEAFKAEKMDILTLRREVESEIAKTTDPAAQEELRLLFKMFYEEHIPM